MKSFVIVFFVWLACFTCNSQTIDTVYQAGGTSNDQFRSLYQDDQGNFYVLMKTGGSSDVLFDTPITTTFVDPYIFCKLDSNTHLLWYKEFNYDTPTPTGGRNIAVDAAQSVYLSDPIDGSTRKYDQDGNLIWTMPFSTGNLSVNANGNLEFIGFNSVTNTINGQPITNSSGTVAIMDTAGNYLHHFTINIPEFPFQTISGKDDSGYYGWRRGPEDIYQIARFEMFKCDSNGVIVENKLVNYKNFYFDMHPVYDPTYHRYYVHGFFAERTPLNAEDSSSGTDYYLYLLQLNESLDLIGSLQLSSSGEGVVNQKVLNLLPQNGDILFSGKIHSTTTKLTHFGVLCPLGNLPNHNVVYGKIDHLLEPKWTAVIPNTYFGTDMSGLITEDSAIYIGGKIGQFAYNSTMFDPNGTGFSDIAIIKAYDKDSTSAYFKGRVYVDINQNGVDDGENGVFNAVITNDQVSSVHYTYTDGNFQIASDTGTNVLKSINLPEYWALSTPDSIVINVSPVDTVLSGFKFGMYPIPGIHDLAVLLTPRTPARPGMVVGYNIRFENRANDTLSGTLILVQDSRLTFKSGEVSPDVINEDTLIWNYTDLEPGEIMEFDIVDSLTSAIDMSSSTLPLYNLLRIIPVIGDTIPEDNRDSIYHEITASFDPNDISVFPLCLDVDFASNQEPLEYHIRFQNTGSDTAFNIVIRDTLPMELDVSTFEMIHASHDVDVSINGGVITFYFEHILLPDSSTNFVESNGFVRYEIKIDTAISPGVVFGNSASIYFDYNVPVITNTTKTLVPAPADTLVVESCDSYIAPSGALYLSSQVFTDTITGFLGCDSLIAVDLTIKYASSDSISQVSCGDVLSPSGNHIWTSSGTYQDILVNAVGCDSTIMVDLVVNPIYNTPVTVQLCSGESYVFPDGYTDSSVSGSYTHVSNLQTINFCDSIITTFVVVDSINTTVLQTGGTLTADLDADSYQWFDCLADTVLPGEIDQIFTATIDGLYKVILTDNGCMDTSDCYLVSGLSMLENNMNMEILAYPNPTSGAVTIKLGETIKKTIVMIYDPDGNLVLQKAVSSVKEFDLYLEGSSEYYLIRLDADDNRNALIKVLKL